MTTDDRAILQDYLESLADRVYFQIAPEDGVFPYVSYDFSSSTVSGEYEETLMLDISAWDLPSDGSTTAVETLIETVNAGIDKKSLALTNGYAVFHLNAKVWTAPDDKRFERRLYTYLVSIIERS